MIRNALVTGASRGIGRAIALRLARDGFNVAVNSTSSSKLELNCVRKEIEAIGRKSLAITANVSVDKEVETMVQHVVKELGSLDVMVANAGISQIKPLIDVTSEEWDKIFATNMRGLFLCYKEAAKAMIDRGNGGKIIGACSIVGYRPFPMVSPYSASKWGVRGLTQAAAMEWAKYKITVNAYCPGMFDTILFQIQKHSIVIKTGIVQTAMWDMADEELAKIKGKQKGEVIKDYSNKLIALGRISESEDVANFVSYLASKDSDYMTGQSIMIDGGIEFS
ncbi:unnamed protein product [Rotaria sp. Silwood2]|nr:unnamed protein product [Rotaria sp. Silwood2]CAF3032051.1 unnamed protein product [Rotaria sp. Silwood2]CAF3397387.1 unnamed protein product [Rotaria sp. Silwood2]CAF4192478.1 unnamed protein product [Rotaria sp. Silwood2]CAF4367017.1 unnamed protein product [Rotaria sp. Silwood2]